MLILLFILRSRVVLPHLLQREVQPPAWWTVQHTCCICLIAWGADMCLSLLFVACSRQVLPRLLDREVRKHLARAQGRLEGLQGAVEVLLGEVFAETERTLSTVRGRLGAAVQMTGRNPHTWG